MTHQHVDIPETKPSLIGYIPKNWECVRLGSVFTNRKQKGRKGLPVLSVTMDRGVILRSEIDRKMGGDLPPEQSLLVETGDIAYNMMRMWQGAVGVCSQAGVISPAYVVCRPVKERVDADYMYFLFKSHIGRHLLTSYSYGIHEDRLRLYYDGFALVPIPLPPLHEQKHIVEILSTWDAAIEQTHALICAKEHQKNALKQQLLTGQIRLSGKWDTWCKYQLRDICTLKAGFGFNENYQGTSSGDYPFVKVSDFNLIGNETKIVVANNWITKKTATELGVKPFPYGATIFAKLGAALMLNRRRLLTMPTVLDNNLMAAIPKTQLIDTLFLYYTMQVIDFKKVVKISAVPAISTSDIADYWVQIPMLSEQRAIAAVLSTADDEIRGLEDEVKALERQKKGLMQQLLNGELRVQATNKESKNECI